VAVESITALARHSFTKLAKPGQAPADQNLRAAGVFAWQAARFRVTFS